MSDNQTKPKNVQAEEEILKFRQDNDIFAKSLKQTESGPVFSFYDGPPFATGTPHYGHVVASLMKDIVPRYQTMQGKYVRRVWGWDTHGLPVENLIEKELNLKDKKDILDLGVAKFNEACRDSVLRYADIWQKFIPRIGRWVDMEHAYLTMDPDYMESIWWVFKKMWDQGLIYEGYKAMHLCPRCETTLANFEVTQNYKDIKDLSVTAKFELVDEPGTFVLAWTTTPWTLPANVALAVGEEVEYWQIKKNDSDATIILAK
jgi:isoleucyl-tRNA synthetase